MAKPETETSGTALATHGLRGARGEGLVFALLAVVIWPVIAVIIVGGYGFLVWMTQLIAGPPGPPGG